MKIFGLACLALFAFQLGQQAYASNVSESREAICASLEKELVALNEAGSFNGLAYIAEGEDVVCSISVGPANVEDGVPFTAETRFRIASATKPFVAALVLKLSEQGSIDLDAPLSAYLDTFEQKPAGRVTIRQMLSHSSGIVNGVDRDDWIDVRRDAHSFAVPILDVPLDFEPDSAFAYSNAGYQLLGLVIENITGLDFGSALERHLLEPLGLDDTGTVARGETVERLADGYYFSEGRLAPFDPYDEDGQPYAAGMMYSTAADLTAWNNALYNGEVFSRAETQEMMRQPRFDAFELPDGRRMKAAYGLFVTTDPNSGLDYVGHDWRFGPFTTENRYYGDSGMTTIVFDNANGDFSASTSSVSAVAAKLSAQIPAK